MGGDDAAAPRLEDPGDQLARRTEGDELAGDDEAHVLPLGDLTREVEREELGAVGALHATHGGRDAAARERHDEGRLLHRGGDRCPERVREQGVRRAVLELRDEHELVVGEASRRATRPGEPGERDQRDRRGQRQERE
jgi:hypothetical protein